MEKILIVDGNSVIHRAFHALPLLHNDEGLPTNAVYGFATMLFKILKQEQPEYVVIAFDKGKTFRHNLYQEYKGTRPITDEDLRPQFSLVRELLDVLDIAYTDLEDYEADDIIGTLGKKSQVQGLHAILLTGDKDALQLIDSNITVYLMRKGITNIDICNIEYVQEKYGMLPAQLIDLKALMGDSSDNIPGVPGVGEKTAIKLIGEYHSLAVVYANIEQMKKSKVQESIQKNKDQAELSKVLGTIVCNAPISLDLEHFRHGDFSLNKAGDFFQRMKFNSLLKELTPDKIVSTDLIMEKNSFTTLTCEKCNDLEEFCHGIHELKQEKEFYFYFLRDEKQEEIFIGYATDKQAKQIVCNLHANISLIRTALEDLVSEKFVIYDYKEFLHLFYDERFIQMKSELIIDLGLLAYLDDPNANKYNPQQLSERNQLIELSKDLSLEEQGERALNNMQILENKYSQAVQDKDMWELYLRMELPLTLVLAKMEKRGFLIDRKMLIQQDQELTKLILLVEEKIYNACEMRFNLNSPKQLAEVLFEKLHLPTGKKNKTGYSTNAEVLEKMALEYEVVANILEYRQLTKLKSTYTEGLLRLLGKDERIHTTFQQTVAATGRLSSTEPNLQNIPVRYDIGKKIRQVFIPNPGQVLIAADYSQIELRLLAHFAGDENLIDAFRKGQDIHTRTASEVFDVPFLEVTPEIRRKAKAVNFGIIYGISDFGLSRDLGIGIKESEFYIKTYFSRYPKIKSYFYNTIIQAKENGYVETLYKRRRAIPELKVKNKMVQSFGERIAMNSPLQGTAADLIKLAMIKVEEEIENRKLNAKLILQVHDELMLTVPLSEVKEVKVLLKEAMMQVTELAVPLEVDVKIGANWYLLEKIGSEE